MPENRRQRRSPRRALELAIRVFGTDFQGKDFVEDSATLVVSRNGAKICLKRKLIPEQEIRILCLGNNREALFRVVRQAGEPTSEFSFWGVECLKPGEDIWEGARPRPGPKLDLRPSPKLAPRPDPKLDPRPSPKLAPRPAPQLGPRPGPQLDPRSAPKLEPRSSPKLEPKPGPKLEPRPGPKLEPRPGPQLDPKLEPRPGPRLDPRPGPKLAPRPDARLGPRPRPKLDPRSGPQLGPKSSSNDDVPSQVVLRCSQCGMRELINLEETQVQAIRRLKGLVRICPACGAQGLWRRVSGKGH